MHIHPCDPCFPWARWIDEHPIRSPFTTEDTENTEADNQVLYRPAASELVPVPSANSVLNNLLLLASSD